jgi:hypothetical protein
MRDVVTVLSTLAGQHYFGKLLDLKEVRANEKLQTLRSETVNVQLEEVQKNQDVINPNFEGLKEKLSSVSDTYKLLMDKCKEAKIPEKVSDEILTNVETMASDTAKLDSILKEACDENTYSSVNIIVNNLNTSTFKIKEIVEKFCSDSNNFVPNLNKFYEFLDSLTLLQESAFIHILVFLVLLCIVFNILGVLFGNEMIKYFNIENKFPSLSSFLKLRAKFQKYYLA